jgi:putative ABC transport system permease protein
MGSAWRGDAVLTLKLALRTLLKRKGRMALIAVLVAFGTILIVFGGTIASSAETESRNSIIENFTGDFIVYSAKSKELPSPFAFNTPLPNIQEIEALEAALASTEGIAAYAAYAQNYGLIQVTREGRQYDLPFIFYAVRPGPYRKVFSNVEVAEGSFFGLEESSAAQDGASPDAQIEKPGILVSRFQNENYLKNYGVELAVGDQATLLGITEGGVNAARSAVVGIFEPRRYKSVFNYINFMDATTYSALYNYTGVEGLPADLEAGLLAASEDEASIFGLAGDDTFAKIDLDSLKSQALSGFTMVAVKLSDHSRADEVRAALEARTELGIKTARWDEASGFYARISKALQAFIFLATALIFLVVTMIFMNTLIINVVERTAEIGTMRAIGADKSFVRGVFLAETLMLNVAAALAGMAASAAFLAVFGSGGLPLPEQVSQFLIGGGALPLRAGPASFAIALAAVVVVSVLATVYPVKVATAITPLKAMSDR